MYVLSAQRREEFLSGNMLCRLEMSLGGGHIAHPVLYLKTDYVTASFLHKQRRMKLRLFEAPQNLICYAVEFDEGLEEPTYMYSVVETHSEKEALTKVLAGAELDVVLFNDFALEIGAACATPMQKFKFKLLEAYSPPGPDYTHSRNEAVSQQLSSLIEQRSFPYTLDFCLENFKTDTKVTVISRDGSDLTLNGFASSTLIHEMLPQIVTDHTDLAFVHSPYVEKSPGNFREFSDALLVGEPGLISLQAKSFEFIENPPETWGYAKKRLKKNLKKAASQTKGSSRMLAEGKDIFENDRRLSLQENGTIIHAIFVPSLDLVDKESLDALDERAKYLAAIGHHFVLLDPMQLLRTVQAADFASGRLPALASWKFFELLITRSNDGLARQQYATPVIYRW